MIFLTYIGKLMNAGTSLLGEKITRKLCCGDGHFCLRNRKVPLTRYTAPATVISENLRRQTEGKQKIVAGAK